MSQVKNLRAMFESRGDEPALPDRGRSPAGFGSGTASGSNSPRPLSSVRTNFVAVEKDGKMGLRRDPSHDSSTPTRKPSTDMDIESTSSAPQDASEKVPRKLFTEDPIPESPRTPVAPSKPDMEQPADPVGKKPSTKTDSAPKASAPVSKTKEPAKATATQSTGPTKKATTTRPTATAPPAKAPPKTSAPAKTSTTTAKRAEPKTAPRTLATKTSHAPGGLKQSSSAPNMKPPPRDTGFVKPRPKSPTKPVRLPASLMAPTASSASKGTDSRQTLSRQSGSLQPPSTTVRASSRASISTTDGSTGKTLRRQGSTVSRPRPSFGPPPKKATQGGAAPKKEQHVDESFLARMMRPTQSSSSKVNDKTPPTPPRKLAARPSTSNTERSSMAGGSVKGYAKASGSTREREISPQASESFVISEDLDSRTLEAETVEAAASHSHDSTVEPIAEHLEATEPELVSDVSNKDQQEELNVSEDQGIPAELQSEPQDVSQTALAGEAHTEPELPEDPTPGAPQTDTIEQVSEGLDNMDGAADDEVHDAPVATESEEVEAPVPEEPTVVSNVEAEQVVESEQVHLPEDKVAEEVAVKAPMELAEKVTNLVEEEEATETAAHTAEESGPENDVASDEPSAEKAELEALADTLKTDMPKTDEGAGGIEVSDEPAAETAELGTPADEPKTDDVADAVDATELSPPKEQAETKTE